MPAQYESLPDFGDKMNRLIVDSGMSVKEISHALGISESAIRMWKSGHRRPDHNNLRRLCHLFNVPTTYFDRTYTDRNGVRHQLQRAIEQHRRITEQLQSDITGSERMALSEKLTKLARKITRLEYDLQLAQQEYTNRDAIMSEIPLIENGREQTVLVQENANCDMAYKIDIREGVFTKAVVYINSDFDEPPAGLLLVEDQKKRWLGFYDPAHDDKVQPLYAPLTPVRFDAVTVLGTVSWVELDCDSLSAQALAAHARIHQAVAHARSNQVPDEAIAASVLRLTAEWSSATQGQELGNGWWEGVGTD